MELHKLHKYVMSSVGNQSDVFPCKYEGLSILQQQQPQKIKFPVFYICIKKEKKYHVLCLHPIYQISMEFFLQVLTKKKFRISIVK